ncbi:MAG TPA: potassium-transporting ATPase subunit C [Solirubrobacteraceae bacterium]|nr:potassium-transporting ATPase subunit C [Solirubrobacteraceae bacterium]
MRRDILTGFLSMIILTILLGFAYPMLVTGVSQGIFPGKADGSLIKRNGVVVGSALIGQQFYEPVIGTNGKAETVKGVAVIQPDPRYFQTRPSGTGQPYVTGGTADNAAGSAFSNAGPNSVATRADDLANIQTYLKLEQPYDPGLSAATIPVDAVNSSASSVDPDISVANARIQAHRVAAVRHLPLSTVDALVARYTTARSLGFLGEPGVNVLELNLALDRGPGANS